MMTQERRISEKRRNSKFVTHSSYSSLYVQLVEKKIHSTKIPTSAGQKIVKIKCK